MNKSKEKIVDIATLVKEGDKIYVPSALYVYRGSDDFHGGLATISKVIKEDLPIDHFNYCFVRIKERPGTGYNLRVLLGQQESLKAEYGETIAHPDPDLREEFNPSPNADWK